MVYVLDKDRGRSIRKEICKIAYVYNKGDGKIPINKNRFVSP